MYKYSEYGKGFGDVLTDTLILGTHLFKWLLPLAFAEILLVQGLPMLLGFNISLDASQMEGMAENLWPTLAGVIIFMVVVVATFMIAMLRYGHRIIVEDPISVSEALQYGLRKTPVFIFATLIFMFCYMAGIVLLVIPGIIVMVGMSLYVALIAIDGAGFDAPMKSFKLVWGDWWWTFGIYLLWFIIAAIAFAIIMAILEALGVPTYFTMFEQMEQSMRGGSMPAIDSDLMLKIQLVVQALSVLVMPFQIALMLVLRHELKLRKKPKDGSPEDFKGIAA
jgi:hypothetical protein